MEEKITLQKFFSGMLSAKTGVKALAFLPWIIVILFIAFTFYRAYFVKTNANISKPTVHMDKGSGNIGEVHQENVYFDEKTWEVGLGVGAISYDNKSGMFAGAWVKKKF